MRTASLARELVRGLLGDGGEPTLAVEQGPMTGTSRALPPPVATVVIGRGDEASWVILDSDLSRTHAEIKRDWDGVHVRDLGSKNGTRLDGVAIDGAGSLMADGGLLELGSVQLRFSDPAERHLRGDLPMPQAAIRLRMPSIPPSMTGKKRVSGSNPIAPAAAAAARRARSPIFWLALALAGAAIGAAIWILIS
jgi:predicted component of type VI protein secretion system